MTKSLVMRFAIVFSFHITQNRRSEYGGTKTVNLLVNVGSVRKPDIFFSV